MEEEGTSVKLSTQPSVLFMRGSSTREGEIADKYLRARNENCRSGGNSEKMALTTRGIMISVKESLSACCK
mgnify:CR=1 FL=1